MRALVMMLVFAAACGDNRDGPAAATPSDAAPDAPPALTTRGPCLDHADALPRPTADLPCELLPPGFSP